MMLAKRKIKAERPKKSRFTHVYHRIKQMHLSYPESKKLTQELQWLNRHFPDLCELIKQSHDHHTLRDLKKHIKTSIKKIKNKKKLTFYKDFLIKLEKKLERSDKEFIVALQSSVYRYHYSFEQMPSEILSYIFSYLDVKSLCQMSAVDRRSNTLANHDSLWRPHLVNRTHQPAGSNKNIKNIYKKSLPSSVFRQLYEEYSLPKPGNRADYDYSIKFVVAGRYYSGSQSLVLRYTTNFFSDDFSHILEKRCEVGGFGIFLKYLALDGHRIQNQIRLYREWESLDGIYRATRAAHVVFLLVDLCDESSLQFVEDNIDIVKRSVYSRVRFVIIGTKNDRKNKRRVTHERLAEFASAHDAGCYITSSNTGENIMQAFIETNRYILKKLNIQPKARSRAQKSGDEKKATDTQPHESKKCVMM